MGLGHDVWNRFSTNQRFGAPLKKNGNKVCPWMHGSVSGFGPSFSSVFLLLPPRSSFLVFPPSPSFSFLFLPPPSSPFLTLPPPSSSFLLPPPPPSLSFFLSLPHCLCLLPCEGQLNAFLRALLQQTRMLQGLACRIFGVHPPRELAGCCSSLDTNSMCQNATEHVRMPAKQIR